MKETRHGAASQRCDNLQHVQRHLASEYPGRLFALIIEPVVMSSREIETAVRGLSKDEVAAFRRWFLQFDEQGCKQRPITSTRSW